MDLITGLLFGVFFGSILAGAASLLTYLYLFLVRREYRCEYVGTDGVCDFDFIKMRRGHPGHVLLFKDASELRTGLTPRFIHGFRAATAYQYWWTSATGEVVLTISGEHYAGTIPPESRFHYAAAAQTGWVAFKERSESRHEANVPNFDMGNGTVAEPQSG